MVSTHNLLTTLATAAIVLILLCAPCMAAYPNISINDISPKTISNCTSVSAASSHAPVYKIVEAEKCQSYRDRHLSKHKHASRDRSKAVKALYPTKTCVNKSVKLYCDKKVEEIKTPEVVVPTPITGITTKNLCKDGTCEVGGSRNILVLTNYNNATDVSYAQLLTFLKQDTTDERLYTSTYVCADFAVTLHDNAESVGIRSGWIGAYGCDHAFNVFETTDKGTVYIDCTGTVEGSVNGDKILNCVIGKPLTGQYLFKDSGIINMGCTVKDTVVYW